jgi:hypothetical protein
MAIVKEFKEFAMRGNVVDLAVGVIIGAAFGKIVTSLVSRRDHAAYRLPYGRCRFYRQKNSTYAGRCRGEST